MRISQSPIRKPCLSWPPVTFGLVFALIAAPVAAAPASDDILARAISGPLRCEIQKSQTGDMVRLVGLAFGMQPIAGTSHFVMIKSGRSGSSNMAQSQQFALKAQQQAVVGQTTTNLDPGGRIAVDFSLQADRGLVCRVHASLER